MMNQAILAENPDGAKAALGGAAGIPQQIID
jgi:hypothetical protein